MLEIISSILEAERKADEIIKQAEKLSKENKVNTETKCEAIRFDAVDQFKTKKAEALEKLEIEANSKYDEVIKSGEVKAKTIIDKASERFDQAVENVIKEILG